MKKQTDYFMDLVKVGLQDKLVRPIAFFDIESTGLDVDFDQIIQLNIQVLSNTGIESKTWWVMPSCEIQKSAYAVHGIDIPELEKHDAKSFKEYAKEVYYFIAGCDLAGYNILKFDIPMLENELVKSGIDVDFSKRNILDVQSVYAKVFSRSLTAAYENLTGALRETAHEAEQDVKDTMIVFHKLVEHHNIGENNDEWIGFYQNSSSFVDYAGKFYKEDDVYYFNFGPDRGKSVDTNPKLLEWMLDKDFTRNTKMWCNRLLNMMYEQPDEEKEFLDEHPDITDQLK